MYRNSSAGVIAAALSLTAIHAVHAEDALDEIVVTAQKRAENLQDVPISVSVMDAGFLADNAVKSVQDLAGSVPGFVVTNSVGHGLAPVSIRGVGGPSGGGSIFNDEPVAIYLDGVYVARLGLAVQNLVDVQSIQVLRGPQGTLYGRNSTAGAVLITTKRPTDHFEAEVRGSYGSFDQSRLSGVISGPLAGDTVTGRLALSYGDGGGYGTNIVTGQDVGGSRDKTARGSLQFKPSDTLKIDVIGTYQNQYSLPATFAIAALTQEPPPHAPYVASPAIYDGNPFVRRPDYQSALESNHYAFDTPNFGKIDSADGTLLVNWNLGAMTFDSITGYRKFRVNGMQDSDSQPNASTYAAATGGLHLLSNRLNQTNEEYTQELRLSQDTERFKWTGGLYYIHEDIDVALDIFGYQAGPPAAGVPAGTVTSFLATQKVDAYAAFADGTYDVTDKFSVTLGGRYSSEKKDVTVHQTVTNATTGANLAPVGDIAPDKTFTNFSPRAVLDYKLADGIMSYVSYSKGFKSGGFNSFDATPSAQAFAPEQIDAFEVGLKTEFLDHRLRVNSSAFYYDYRNLQIRQAVFTGGVAIRTVPKAEIKGAELEVTFVPLDNLTLRSSVAYLDAQLKEGLLQALPTNIGVIRYGAQQFAPPAVFPSENIAGNDMTRAPHWQYYLNAEYKLPITVGTVRFGATFKGQSKVYFSETNQDSNAYVGDAWKEIDARVSFAPIGERWDLAAYGLNLNNDRHLTQATPFSGFPVGVANPPRRWGIETSVRF